MNLLLIFTLTNFLSTIFLVAVPQTNAGLEELLDLVLHLLPSIDHEKLAPDTLSASSSADASSGGATRLVAMAAELRAQLSRFLSILLNSVATLKHSQQSDSASTDRPDAYPCGNFANRFLCRFLEVVTSGTCIQKPGAVVLLLSAMSDVDLPFAAVASTSSSPSSSGMTSHADGNSYTNLATALGRAIGAVTMLNPIASRRAAQVSQAK